MDSQPATNPPSDPSLPPDRSHLLTEQANSRSANLHQLTTAAVLQLMNEEDATIPAVVARAIPAITPLVDTLATNLALGGRLIYLGAGTSGRLGVLDASECPPTFNTDPSMVNALIAGGDSALRISSEGKEDDPAGSLPQLEAMKLTEKDVVIGIAAGGSTPYVHGGLQYAHDPARGCTTALVCCLNRDQPGYVDHLVCLPVGPEIITGSSRLKAGTATKLVLNMITTTTMVKLGKTHGNKMIDLRATNDKLRDRAIRILCEVTGLDRLAAARVLDDAGGRVKVAVERFFKA